MRLIDRTDIELWANKIDSKTYLPILVSRLVKAITPLNTFCEFPSGTAANVGGWDGISECQEGSSYVPLGISLWEFGTEMPVTSKAEKDYIKRTSDPLGYDPMECTYVFVTPRFWKNKDKFKKEKLAEGRWKDIKVYDSRNLEEWLGDAPAVTRWFAEYTGKVPSEGVLTAEEFWKEWAFGPKISLSPSLVTVGREREIQALRDFLKSEAEIRAVRASTKDEAVAFIVACAMQFEKQEHERFFSKTLIAEKSDSFRSITRNLYKLHLIAKFDDYKISYAGVGYGHHVLVPLGADDPYNNEVILLPEPPRDGLVNELVQMEIDEETARKLSRESARNITVLKRLLKFPHSRISWLEKGDVSEIFPALLIGRWNEANFGDVEIIEMLSGLPYAEYRDSLSKWRDLPESPIIQIGHTWRLTSPLDAWANVSGQLRPSDFERLKTAALLALRENGPERDIDPTNLSLGFNPPNRYSRWAREGLIQSLILIGLYGEGLKLSTNTEGQVWVDHIIDELLTNADGELWKSLDHEMPLIAEASPSVFLEKTNQSLISAEKEIMAMFDTDPGILTDKAHHTGLLWALEGLAWMPEYFLDAVVVLTRLDQQKPIIKMLNQPINSLKDIFKSWYHQTMADLEQRISALETLLELSYETGWSVLLSMLPTQHGSAHPTHNLRWRLFGKSKQLNYTYEELYSTSSSVVDLLIKYFNGTENDLAILVEHSDQLLDTDRKKLFKFIESKAGEIDTPDNLVWKKLGKILSQHRSYPNADWALPEEILTEYQALYECYTPKDRLAKHLLLFDDHWPEFPEDDPTLDPNDYDSKAKRLEKRRLRAIEEILNVYGLEKIKEVSAEIKEPTILGQTLGTLKNFEFSNEDLPFFLNHGDGPLNVIQGYFAIKARIAEGDWSIQAFKRLNQLGLSSQELVNILVVLDQSPAIWALLENNAALAAIYWSEVRPFFYRLEIKDKEIGLGYLLKYHRFMAAIGEASHYPGELSTGMIVDILTKAATEKANDPGRAPGYEIARLFKELYQRDDIEKGTIIRLEWFYVEVLDRYSREQPTLLEKEILTDPSFFIEMIKWVYVPKSREKIGEESQELSSEQIASRATRAYRLLKDISAVPGMNDDGALDVDFLNNWVSEVRKLALEADREEVTDIQLGQIFATYPEDRKSNWPPEPIAALIENINTDDLKSGFSSATFNKRGSSSRGAFAGGDIERGHAAYFDRLYANYKIKYPNLAAIFSNLAKGYKQDAKRMDERAERDRLDY